ncbi:MAG: NADH-quinone oxidoreductase subunit C [Ornithinimicrobium sp.]
MSSELARGVQHVSVPLPEWLAEVTAGAAAGYDFFDWLSAVDHTGARGDGTTEPPSERDSDSDRDRDKDSERGGDGPEQTAEPGRGMQIIAHLIASAEQHRIPAPLPRLLISTLVPTGSSIASLTSVFAGAAWHERETHEMFGVEFTGFDDGTDQGLRPLLLPEGFDGTPLAKSFVLAARASKPWPGAKEPGESDRDVRPKTDDASPPDPAPAKPAARPPRTRRRMLPPGVPDPSWGPRDA